MTPHDLELKRYNDIIHRLDQIENTLMIIMNHKQYSKMHKLMNDGVMLCTVYVKDVKDKFKRYAETGYDPSGVVKYD